MRDQGRRQKLFKDLDHKVNGGTTEGLWQRVSVPGGEAIWEGNGQLYLGDKISHIRVV